MSGASRALLGTIPQTQDDVFQMFVLFGVLSLFAYLQRKFLYEMNWQNNGLYLRLRVMAKGWDLQVMEFWFFILYMSSGALIYFLWKMNATTEIQDTDLYTWFSTFLYLTYVYIFFGFWVHGTLFSKNFIGSRWTYGIIAFMMLGIVTVAMAAGWWVYVNGGFPAGWLQGNLFTAACSIAVFHVAYWAVILLAIILSGQSKFNEGTKSWVRAVKDTLPGSSLALYVGTMPLTVDEYELNLSGGAKPPRASSNNP